MMPACLLAWLRPVAAQERGQKSSTQTLRILSVSLALWRLTRTRQKVDKSGERSGKWREQNQKGMQHQLGPKVTVSTDCNYNKDGKSSERSPPEVLRGLATARAAARVYLLQSTTRLHFLSLRIK